MNTYLSTLKAQFSLQRGFTLIELLVVIALIGVLAIGLMTVLNPIEQIQKGADAKRKADLANIQKALELYYNDNGFYPDHSPTGNNWEIINTGNQRVAWGTGSFSPYMPKIPGDPSQDKHYAYYSDGESYWLFASLDRWKNDESVCNPGQVTETSCSIAEGRSMSCGAGGRCNYGVSSPNVRVQ